METREKFLLAKALAIAILVIERNDGPLQSFNDKADMKALLEDMVPDNDMLAYLLRTARIQVTGKPD